MAIRSIEIVCRPCQKCESALVFIKNILTRIELRNKVKINVDIKHTKSLQNVTDYGVGPTQTPVIIINGVVEAAGSVNEMLLSRRIESLYNEA